MRSNWTKLFHSPTYVLHAVKTVSARNSRKWFVVKISFCRPVLLFITQTPVSLEKVALHTLTYNKTHTHTHTSGCHWINHWIGHHTWRRSNSNIILFSYNFNSLREGLVYNFLPVIPCVSVIFFNINPQYSDGYWLSQISSTKVRSYVHLWTKQQVLKERSHLDRNRFKSLKYHIFFSVEDKAQNPQEIKINMCDVMSTVQIRKKYSTSEAFLKIHMI